MDWRNTSIAALAPPKWNTYYYTLADRLIGALDGNGTDFYFTDGLGSILSSFSNVAGGAAVKGNQVFGPYGKSRYAKGTINTAKGFTGQYNDSLTGLDYYGARYYDAVAGVFLSADTVQGNGSGENPYAYVGGNPETWSDPTGEMVIDESAEAAASVGPSETGGTTTGPLTDGPNTESLPALPADISVSSDGTMD